MSHTVKLIEQTGETYWITSRRARELIRDRLVRVGQVRPLVLIELPTVRRTSRALYVHDRYDWALTLYREVLLDAIRMVETGKTARADNWDPELERLARDAYTPLPWTINQGGDDGD